jgi:hypothetical protein
VIYLEKHAAYICHLSATINHTKSVNQPAKYLGVGCGGRRGRGTRQRRRRRSRRRRRR